MLTSKQRAFLRSKATKEDTSFQIGKGGISETLLSAVDDALTAKELVKIKCLENCEYTPREACDGIAEALEAEGVQVIGNKFVLFRISPEHRKYDLLNFCEIERETKQPAKKKTPAPKKPLRRGRAAAGPEEAPQSSFRPQRRTFRPSSSPSVKKTSSRSAGKPSSKGGSYTVSRKSK